MSEDVIKTIDLDQIDFHMVSIGDVIKCINNDEEEDSLTIDKLYTIRNIVFFFIINKGWIFEFEIVDDSGLKASYDSKRFVYHSKHKVMENEKI